MQHGFGVSGIVKIAGLPQQHEVSQKDGTATGMLCQLFVFNKVQANPTGSQAKTQYQQQRWENSPNTPCVKMTQAKSLIAQVAQYQSGDEVARDDEKNIHANKATAQLVGKCVKNDDDQNRDGPQAINVRSVICLVLRNKGASLLLKNCTLGAW